MAKLTVESLAKPVEALENAVAVLGSQRAPKDWRKTIGMFGDREFMRELDEECLRLREAEREAARPDDAPE